jgi:hypothetical protein
MPTWEKLAEDKRSLEQVTGFHMAQVKSVPILQSSCACLYRIGHYTDDTLNLSPTCSCLAQGDLCATNNIKFCTTFPSPTLCNGRTERLPDTALHIRSVNKTVSLLLGPTLQFPQSAAEPFPSFPSSSPVIHRLSSHSYEDGHEVDPYTSSRSYEALSTYIDGVSHKYAKREPLSISTSSSSSSSSNVVEGKGQVFKLDEAGLKRIKKEGGFVKFFAPCE